jgi:dethiobiotin synthetase
MKQAYFVTGTDTDVGKTYVACKIIRDYIAQGYKVVGMKPVAAGCEYVNGEWINADVLKLMQASNVLAPRELVNPYCFKEPIAPHIAAEKAGVEIEIEVIRQAFDKLAMMADVVVIEGAGGFLVPINHRQSMADLAVALNIPIILVVGMKLGCINHALLTVEAIKTRQLALRGWVANEIDREMLVLDENMASLLQRIQQPKLFSLAYTASV